ncbi:MAG: iron-sulfur cluster assembly accessory protein [Actinomycetota bacterium]|nr:iron-sulfur cluster assembly accessory protein [Actinomycetota bacterium]MDH5223741.1 iron-sulfur cluster assembly accessory protein [Actinomycetota bacterium]MDH5313823.1 iron-sulfur cluster assembly accessory protein [Actinomycetota bacterium]
MTDAIATSPLITVTEAAARKARSLAERDGRPEAALRVRVTAGGCSGFGYQLTLEDAPVEGDQVVVGPGGFRVLIDAASAPIVSGSTLEFNDSLMDGGLRMVNPQAKHECACGDSFSL